MLSTKNEKYLREAIVKLLQRFQSAKESVSQEKVNQILQVLCASIEPEKVYVEFALQIGQQADIAFVQEMIETLTLTLAASPMERPLREKLRGNAPTVCAPDKVALFMSLYETWCYNPISTLTLCLLSQNYELAYNLIPLFSTEEVDT